MFFAVYVAVFAVTSLFWAWVLFRGGAERLEGSFLARLLVDDLASRWSAQGIKLFVGLTWLIQGVLFVVLVVLWFLGH